MGEERRRRARLCVFAGSKEGLNAAFGAAACELGDALVRRHIDLVYGGARDGLMGILAERMLSQGGAVYGVVPSGLWLPEEDHPGVTQMYHVTTMAERKGRMMSLADGFLVLPGGVGTLDELFEVLTLQLLGDPAVARKPLAIWNVEGYFDRLVELIAHLSSQGFLSRPSPGRVDEQCAPLLDYIEYQIERERPGVATPMKRAH